MSAYHHSCRAQRVVMPQSRDLAQIYHARPWPRERATHCSLHLVPSTSATLPHALPALRHTVASSRTAAIS
jgi:hypothetical protein